MKRRIFLILALTSMSALARDPVESVEPDPMGGASTPASNATTNKAQEQTEETLAPSDPIEGKGKESAPTPSAQKKNNYPTQTSTHT